MNKVIIMPILISVLFWSCSNSYQITYNTYLKESEKKDLNYSDDKFDFTFIPVANGIWFKIKNKTSTTAYLLWDNSYFIEPSGNSYKAIDVDALNTPEEALIKENNESVIPSNSSYARFTTPNTNINKFNETNTVIYNNLFTNNSYANTKYNSYFKTGAYWETTFEKEEETSKKYYGQNGEDYADDDVKLNLKCNELRSKTKLNNNLGLGLTIKYNDAIYEYRFDFKISQINIYEISGDTKKIVRTLKEENDFIIK